jgi:hypothetical protein
MPKGMKRKMNKAVTKKKENLSGLTGMGMGSKSKRSGPKSREKRLEGKPM